MEKNKVSKSDFLHLFVRPDKLNINKESQNKFNVVLYNSLFKIIW